ncbi:unnamed protein product [Plasmodium vivax]|uniref:(malaria parasite P. vivax) hypothetical protein n=1 Tax=Plasmodium vivax TaxID=5855 RepID=A0A8S4HD81_PLAVI|nr:unnamed protein product [Plasmodium vivax]
MHGDIKNDIIKSLPFTFSRVELTPRDGRGQKGEAKQTNSGDAPPHVVGGAQDGHTDESGETDGSGGTDGSVETDGSSPPEGTDQPNYEEYAGGGIAKDKRRKRKKTSKGSRFTDQVNKHHSHELGHARNRKKKNFARKSAATPRKQHHLCAQARGRDTASRSGERDGGDRQGGDRQGGDHQGGDRQGGYLQRGDPHPDAVNERAYVTIERSKLSNWRVKNYLDVDRLSLSVSTSSMGDEAAGEEGDSSSDGASGRGNDIFGESLFSSFNLSFDPFGGATDKTAVGLAVDSAAHPGEGFPSDARFTDAGRVSPNRTGTDQRVANPPLHVDAAHSPEEDKDLHLFDSLKNFYANQNKKVKLINYSKILNTSLCKRVQDAVEGQPDGVLQTSSGGSGRRRSGRDGRKDARNRGDGKNADGRGDPPLGPKLTEHNVKAIIMNIKKRLGFYSGEERKETQGRKPRRERRHETRRDELLNERHPATHAKNPPFCDSLNYSRDEPLSDSVTSELRNGEEPESVEKVVAKVDAASQSAQRRVHKGNSHNLLNYKSFVSDDFNLPNDGDDLLGSSAYHNSQGGTPPSSSSEGCVSTDDEDVFALSTSSVQFKRSFLRAIGRASDEVGQAHSGEEAYTDGGPPAEPPLGHTPTKQKERNCQEVLKREELPPGTDHNCFGSTPSSEESPPKGCILDGEGGLSKVSFNISEDTKKEKMAKLISCGEKYDGEVGTYTGGSPKDCANEEQQQSTCNGSNSQGGEENESNGLRKTEGVDTSSQEMNAFMLDAFDNQVRHLNELVASIFS